MLDNYDYLKTKVYNLTNINLDAYKERQMKRRIDAFIDRQNLPKDILIKEEAQENSQILIASESSGKTMRTSYKLFIRELEEKPALLNSFVNYLTINVSEFFRNEEQWEVLENDVLPYLLSKFGKELKIWSAACSTGDEPYSLVMLLTKFLPLSKIHVYASDIDEEIIEKAKLGVYNIKSLKGVPKEFMDKYFSRINKDTYQISESIKSRVTFKKHDLLGGNYPNKCNLIVCRNVLIYFTEEAKDEIYHKFNDSLEDGGILFVGSTEQIIHSSKYNFQAYKSFFYQKP